MTEEGKEDNLTRKLGNRFSKIKTVKHLLLKILLNNFIHHKSGSNEYRN